MKAKVCNPYEPRFSLAAFRRYEPIFFRVLAVHGEKFQPDEQIIYQLPGSTRTHEARIRDAFHSLLSNNWETDLDVPKLEKIWPRLTSAISADGSSNVIRAKEYIERASFPDIASNPSQLTVTNPKEIELRACLVLAHHETLQGTSFVIKDCSQELQAILSTITTKYPNAVIQAEQPNDYSNFSII